MEIQKEQLPPHAILSYSKNVIRIQDEQYQCLTLVSAKAICSLDETVTISALSLEHLQSIDLEGIEVMIIGHQETFADVPFEFRQWFAKRQIGIEVMSLGAACRTFNILLGEDRGVLGVFLLG